LAIETCDSRISKTPDAVHFVYICTLAEKSKLLKIFTSIFDPMQLLYCLWHFKSQKWKTWKYMLIQNHKT